MAMKDFDAKQFMLQRGERVGLGVALFLMVLLIIVNLFLPPNGFFSGSPKAKVVELQGPTRQVEQGLASNRPGEADKPGDPGTKLTAFKFDPLGADKYLVRSDWFQGYGAPDLTRRVPELLTIDEAHAKVANVLAATYVFDQAGNIYALENAPERPIRLPRALKKHQKLIEQIIRAQRAQGGMGEGPGGGAPGMMMSRRMGGRGGMGGMPGMAGGSPLAMPGSMSAGGGRKRLVAIPLEKIAERPNVQLAEQARPVRMAIIAGSFPYKAQLEEFRDKLHLSSIEEVLSEVSNKEAVKDPNTDPQALPAFRFIAVEVQRRTLDATGQPVTEWTTIPLNNIYKPYIVATGQRLEPEEPRYQAISFPGLVMPRLRQFRPGNQGGDMMAMGAPGAVGAFRGGAGAPGAVRPGVPGTTRPGIPGIPGAGNDLEVQGEQFEDRYPKVESDVKNLTKTLDELEGKNLPKIKAPSRFDAGEFDIFNPNPVGAFEGVEGMGPGGLPGGAGPVPSMRMPLGAGTRSPTGRAPGERSAIGPEGELGMDIDVPEHCLVRVIDVTVEPGMTYEYRMAVRMANPNYGHKDVASPSYSKDKELPLGPWYVMPEKVVVPPELEYYAVDQKEIDGREYRGLNWNRTFDRDRQLVMQAHRYLDAIPTRDRKALLIGEWSVAERFAVARGEYVGQTHRVEVPYWSAEENKFDIANDSSSRVRNQGVEVNFGLQRPDGQEIVLVDFEGGRQSYDRVVARTDDGVKTQKVEDSCTTEVLLFDPDGRLLARDGSRDREDEKREKRVKEVRDRIVKVKQAKLLGAPGVNGGEGGRPGGLK